MAARSQAPGPAGGPGQGSVAAGAMSKRLEPPHSLWLVMDTEARGSSVRAPTPVEGEAGSPPDGMDSEAPTPSEDVGMLGAAT